MLPSCHEYDIRVCDIISILFRSPKLEMHIIMSDKYNVLILRCCEMAPTRFPVLIMLAMATVVQSLYEFEFEGHRFHFERWLGLGFSAGAREMFKTYPLTLVLPRLGSARSRRGSRS